MGVGWNSPMQWRSPSRPQPANCTLGQGEGAADKLAILKNAKALQIFILSILSASDGQYIAYQQGCSQPQLTVLPSLHKLVYRLEQNEPIFAIPFELSREHAEHEVITSGLASIQATTWRNFQSVSAVLSLDLGHRGASGAGSIEGTWSIKKGAHDTRSSPSQI
jgi:hypothetical protein